MRLFAATTIAATLAGGAVLAEAHMMSMSTDDMIRTRDITGGNIYTTSPEGMTDWNADTAFDTVGEDWADIGEIEDVILDRNGQLVGIVGEVGGFLDIGDRHVFLPVSDLRLVPVDNEEYAYVTRYSEEELEALEDIDEGWWD